ncbi:MAG: OB-fold domain-containing protein [Thermoanaerobaculia bacterium]|nr:OB-fold domain-containing protein [Thermoanaerobaculia bacterium]
MPLNAHVIDGDLAVAQTRVESRFGLVATAAWDEDALTLASTAALRLLDRNPGAQVAALVTATLSAPLTEPGVNPYLAEVLGLQGRGLHASEHAGTAVAGLTALGEGLALVSAGIEPVLVVATDARRRTGGHAMGDGAVALLISADGEGSLIESAGADVELFVDRWVRRGSKQVETGDRSLDRFGPAGSFVDKLAEGFDEVLRAGADTPLLPRCGALGTPTALVHLLLAKGRTLVAGTAGGVSRAFAVTPGPGSDVVRQRVQAEMDSGVEGTVPRPPDETTFNPFTSQAVARRERGATYRLEAMRDPATGEVVYPPPPVAAAEGLEPTNLSRAGTVLTFANDHVFPMGGPVTMAVVELDGGGRFYGQVAAGRRVEIGDRVRLVLRRLHSGGGLPHYFWKVLPESEDG